MRIVGRWIQIVGFVLIFTLGMSVSVFAEDESRLPEIFDMLKSITKNLEEGNYGTASADLDYLSEIFKEQEGTWLLGCFVKKYKDWLRVGKGDAERVGSGVMGGGTTITQNYTKNGSMIEAKVMISPLASGLGALLNNPMFRNSAKTKQRRLPNGMTVMVKPDEISGSAGQAQLSWKVIKGKVSQPDLLGAASGTVSPGCVKEFAGGQ